MIILHHTEIKKYYDLRKSVKHYSFINFHLKMAFVPSDCPRSQPTYYQPSRNGRGEKKSTMMGVPLSVLA